MKKEIVINASKDRARIAIVEDGELAELYVEHPENVRTLGNIYLGRVAKVMSQIHAAFVDIGQRQDAFLHFSDLTDNAAQLFAIAGEDIPGLESGPILSKAPQKRVADDESEPDVEEALEVEDAAEESNTSRSRSRRRRRRGGRRRGRGNDQKRTEEEEEQEERSLPHVIDLTQKTGSVRSSRDESSDDETPSAGGEDERGNDDEEKPRRSRSRSRKKTDTPDEPSADEPSADEPEATEPEATEPEATEPDTETADEPEAEEKPKRSRSRSRSRRKKTDSTDDASGEAASAADDTPEDDAAEQEEKPKRSRSRSRKKKDDAPTDEETPDEEPEPKDEPAAKETSARKTLPSTIDLTSKPSSRSAGGADEGDDENEAKPSRSRSRSRKKNDDQTDASNEESDDTNASRSSRSRRGRGRRASSDDSQNDSSQDDSDDSGNESRSRRGRGRGRGRSTSSDADSGNDTSNRDTKERESKGRSSGGRDSGGRDSGGRDSGRSKQSDGKSQSNGRGNRQRGGGKSNVAVPTKPEDLLSRNGRVLVKITKEPISSKGSRVSTDISLAGRFLVLVPAADYVAVSKKIESAKERRRLRTLATSLKPDNFGVIVRTVAEGREAKVLDQDLRLLVDKWRKIEQKLKGKPEPPVLLYEDVNMVSSIVRDLFTEDYDRILVDDPRLHKNLQSYVKAVAPQMADRVVLHKGNQPVFRSAGLEKQVAEAFSERVNMKGGGYLIIEHTEAMHVVDVNSGRAGRGKRRAEENLLNVNVEAAREIAKQLRLRDLGGIIVVDFIDLRYERDRRKVTDAIKKEFAKDRAVTKVIGMSDFGVMQITRQRLRPSITTQNDDDAAPEDAMQAAGAAEIPQPERRRSRDDDRQPDDRQPDDHRADESDDRPRRPRRQPTELLTPVQLAERVQAWLAHYREVVDARYAKRPIVVSVHPLMGSFLRRGFPSPLTRWKFRLRGLPFRVEEDPKVDPLEFAVNDQKSGRSLLSKYPLEG